MAIEEKRLSVVGSYRFIHAFTVQETVIEYRHDRVLLIDDAAVDVDRGCHGFERTIR